jgi:hypothetical protein
MSSGRGYFTAVVLLCLSGFVDAQDAQPNSNSSTPIPTVSGLAQQSPGPSSYDLPSDPCQASPCIKPGKQTPPPPKYTYDTGLCDTLAAPAAPLAVVGAEPGAAVFGISAAICNITAAGVNGGAQAMAQQTATEGLIKACELPFSASPTIGTLAAAGCQAAIDAIKEAGNPDTDSPCETPIPQIQQPCPQPGPTPPENTQATQRLTSDASPGVQTSFAQDVSDLEGELGVQSPISANPTSPGVSGPTQTQSGLKTATAAASPSSQLDAGLHGLSMQQQLSTKQTQSIRAAPAPNAPAKIGGVTCVNTTGQAPSGPLPPQCK